MKKLLLTILFLCPTIAYAQPPDYQEGLPFIVEEVDEIAILLPDDTDHWRVVFFRGDSVLATRLVADEMVWFTQDGRFYLVWEDYWTANRLISAEHFAIYNVAEDTTQVNGPWWTMFRNMRDLQQP